MDRFIAISDLHLKFLAGVDKKWQEDRYKRFIDDLVDRCAVEEFGLIIAGDSLDSINPRREEIQMFLYLMHRLYLCDVTTLLVVGNHEVIKRGSSLLDFLEVDKFTNVYYRRNYVVGDTTYHLVNHDQIHDYVPILNTHNVLISHFRCNVNKFITEEIDVAKFTAPYDLCIVGDIHTNLDFGKVWYCNAPLNKDFEANPKCGCLEVYKKISGWDVQRVALAYPSLISKKLTPSEYAKLRTNAGQDYYKIEVEGTPEELRSVLPKLRNTILHKVPVVPAVLTKEGIEEVAEQVTSGIEGLENYMKSLKYEEGLIAEMMKELRRSDD